MTELTSIFPTDDLAYRCRALEIENADLRSRVAELTMEQQGFAPAFGLSGTEDRFLRSLLGRHVSTREEVLADCYPGRIAPVEPAMVDVMVCKLRRKLGRHAITIETVRGRGYHIPPASREALMGAEVGAQAGDCLDVRASGLPLFEQSQEWRPA